MKKIILILLLSASSLLYASEKGTVTGDNVNLRQKPSINSKAILKLNKGTEIQILKKENQFIFTGNYYGTWYKIKLKSGVTGYIFSTFVHSDKEKREKFNIFFERFKNSVQKKDLSPVKDSISFPLKGKKCFEGQCEELSFNSEKFVDKIKIDEPYMYKMKFAVENNRIKCWYGYEGVYYTLYFQAINNKWQLIEFRIDGC